MLDSDLQNKYHTFFSKEKSEQIENISYLSRRDMPSAFSRSAGWLRVEGLLLSGTILLVVATTVVGFTAALLLAVSLKRFGNNTTHEQRTPTGAAGGATTESDFSIIFLRFSKGNTTL